MLVQTVKKRLLTATRDNEGQQLQACYLGQDLGGTRHGRGCGTGVEDLALGAVDVLNLFLGGLASPCALGEGVDGATTRATLVEEDFLTRDREAILLYGTRPGYGMVGHTVKEDAIHVEEDATDTVLREGKRSDRIMHGK